MAHVGIPAGDGTERERLWQHKPAIGAALNQLNLAIYSNSRLSVREQELARMRVAGRVVLRPSSRRVRRSRGRDLMLTVT